MPLYLPEELDDPIAGAGLTPRAKFSLQDAGQIEKDADYFNYETPEVANQRIARTRANRDRGSISRGFLSGIDNLQASGFGALGLFGDLIGSDTIKDYGIKNFVRNQREASENASDVKDFFSTEDDGAFGDIDNTLEWAGYNFGNLMPSMMESVGSSIVGGALASQAVPGIGPDDLVAVPTGAIAGFFGKSGLKKYMKAAIAQKVKGGMTKDLATTAVKKSITPELRRGLLKETYRNMGSRLGVTLAMGLTESGGMYGDLAQKGIYAPKSSLMLGMLSGASESAFGTMPLLMKSVFAGPLKKIITETGKKKGLRAATGLMWDLMKKSTEEGAQEAFQGFLGSLNQEINDPDFEINSKETFTEWMNAFAAGALGGGVFGGGAKAYDSIQGLRKQARANIVKTRNDETTGGFDVTEVDENALAFANNLDQDIDDDLGKINTAAKQFAAETEDFNNGMSAEDIALKYDSRFAGISDEDVQQLGDGTVRVPFPDSEQRILDAEAQILGRENIDADIVPEESLEDQEFDQIEEPLTDEEQDFSDAIPDENIQSTDIEAAQDLSQDEVLTDEDQQFIQNAGTESKITDVEIKRFYDEGSEQQPLAIEANPDLDYQKWWSNITSEDAQQAAINSSKDIVQEYKDIAKKFKTIKNIDQLRTVLTNQGMIGEDAEMVSRVSGLSIQDSLLAVDQIVEKTWRKIRNAKYITDRNAQLGEVDKIISKPAGKKLSRREKLLQKKQEKAKILPKIEKVATKKKVADKPIQKIQEPNTKYVKKDSNENVKEAKTPNAEEDVQFVQRIGDLWDFVDSTQSGFNKKLQNRFGNRSEQIEEIINKFVPEEFVKDSIWTHEGAPFIDGFNQLITGNGRKIALDKIQEAYPKKWAAYQELVKQKAQEMGIDISGIDKPFFYNAIVGSSKDFPTIVKISNTQNQKELSVSETAETDAHILKEIWSESITADENGNFVTANNRDFNNQFLDRIGESSSLKNSNGEINTKAFNDRMRSAIISLLIGTSEQNRAILIDLLENADALGINSEVNGLVQAGMDLLNVPKEFNIQDEIAEAYRTLIDYKKQKSEGNAKSVEDFLSQGTFSFIEDSSPAADYLFKTIANKGRSAKAVREYFNRYVELTKQHDTTTDSLFGDILPQPKKLLEKSNEQSQQELVFDPVAKTARVRKKAKPKGQTPDTRQPTQEVKTPDFIDTYKTKYKNINAHIIKRSDGSLVLNKMIVPEGSRGQGIGSKFIKDLTDYADEKGVIVKLTAEGDFGGKITGQKRLYKRHGFIENKGTNKDFEISENMYRLPKATKKVKAHKGIERYRDETIIDMTSRDKVLGRRIVNKMTGTNNVEFFDKILSVKGREVFGKYKDAFISIATNKGDIENTARHESLHFAYDLFLTTKEQADFDAAAKKANPDMSDKQAHEAAIEAINVFSQKHSGLTGRLRLFANRIIQRLKRLFGKDNLMDKLNDIYDRSLSGKLAKRGRTRRSNYQGKALNREDDSDSDIVSDKNIDEVKKTIASLGPGRIKEKLLQKARDIKRLRRATSIQAAINKLGARADKALQDEGQKGAYKIFSKILSSSLVKKDNKRTTELIKSRTNNKGEVRDLEPSVRRWLKLVEQVSKISEKKREGVFKKISDHLNSVESEDQAKALIDEYSNDFPMLKKFKYLGVSGQMEILLRVIHTYGAMKSKNQASIEVATKQIQQDIKGSIETLEKKINARKEHLSEVREELLPSIEPTEKQKQTPLGRKALNAISSSFGLRDWMEIIIKNGLGAVKTKAAKQIENVLDLIQESSTKKDIAVMKAHNDFHDAIERIYGNPGKAIHALNKERKEYRKYSNKNLDLSKFQLMQILGFAQQENYKENAIIHNRDVQALLKEMSPEDLKMMQWYKDYYKSQQPILDKKNFEVTGTHIEMTDKNYLPVSVRADSGGLPVSMTSTVFVPPSMNNRVKHKYDVDEEVSIQDMFLSRAEETAHYLNGVDTAIELRGIFAHKDIQKSIENSLGRESKKLFLESIQDWINNGYGHNFKMSSIAKARGFFTWSKFWLNMRIGIKQVTSIPAFGFEIGLKNTAKHLGTAFSEEGRAAMSDLLKSDQVKTRIGLGNTEEVRNAMKTMNSSALRKFLKHAMFANQLGDIVPTLLIGQGIYRSYTEDYHQNGMSLEDAKEKALNKTFQIVESTQQSGKIKDQAAWQRRGGEVSKLLATFTNTTRQFLVKEFTSIINFAANPNKETGKKLARTIGINHALLPLAYNGMNLLINSLLGADPDEDDYDNLLLQMILGPISGFIFFGTLISGVAESLYTGKKNTFRSMVPIEGLLDDVSNLGSAIHNVSIGDTEKAWKNANSILKSNASIYREASKAFKNRSSEGKLENVKKQYSKKKTKIYNKVKAFVRDGEPQNEWSDIMSEINDLNDEIFDNGHLGMVEPITPGRLNSIKREVKGIKRVRKPRKKRDRRKDLAGFELDDERTLKEERDRRRALRR